MARKRPDHRQLLQERVLSLKPDLPKSSRDLHRELRVLLLDAHNKGLLETPPAKIHQLLKHDRASEPKHHVIVGGQKNFNRDKDLPHFQRDDGAWFDFAITIAQPKKGTVDLIGYNFEIRFEREHNDRRPRFVRFDLNPPGHANEERDIRAHIHPGDDDLQVPSPLMSPLEVLQILLYGLRIKRKPRGQPT